MGGAGIAQLLPLYVGIFVHALDARAPQASVCTGRVRLFPVAPTWLGSHG